MEIFRQGSFETIYDMPIEINWSITDMCNYKCSYCFGQKPINYGEFSTIDQIKNAIKHIAKINRPSYIITLSGGEPTIHPHFYDILELFYEALGDRLNYFIIISNGSRDEKLYKKIAEFAKKVNIKFQISIHSEYVEIEHIEELIKGLSDKADLSFSLMFNPDKREYVRYLFDEMLRIRMDYAFSLTIMPLRQPPNFDIIDLRYTEEDLRWVTEAKIKFSNIVQCSNAKMKVVLPLTQFMIDLEKDGERKIITERNSFTHLSSGLLDFKEMNCIFGTSVLRINPYGECFGAVCRASSKKANIFEGNPYEDENWIHVVKCPMENCGCSTNHQIPKFSDIKEAELFCNIEKRKQKELIIDFAQRGEIC